MDRAAADVVAERALVLFSGGQDSTVCLAWALTRFSHVETIGFDYRQRHRVELDCRATVRDAIRDAFPAWRDRLHDDHLLDLGVLGDISQTALTRDAEIAYADDGLPTTFVPARNLVFFTFAAAIAYRRNLPHLVGGMCETDFSGYPDCRNETLKALQIAINLGTDRTFVIDTPLMWRDKAATWALGDALGGAALRTIVIDHTHTCYLGDRATRHSWGFGCGKCPACLLRADGWRRYQAG
ncbi:MAG: 7-cyano-7-deazaguanine synthase QueC [Pseudomonadota bacterium]